MFKKHLSLLLAGLSILLLSGCAADGFGGFNNDFKQKESLYQTTDNQMGLIALYRDSLQKKENDEVRLKLAKSYYNVGDGESALLYLKPLLDKPSAVAEPAKLLQIRSLIHAAKYQEAINNASSLIAQNPKNGEAYNLRGVAYAQAGNSSAAYSDIMAAREHFINDSVALNNLAMLHIIDEQYGKAVETLLPQYMNDVKEPKLVYNLVFALVKSGQREYAKSIIQKENLAPNADELINTLAKIKKAPFAGI